MRRTSLGLALAALVVAGCSGYSNTSLIDPQYRTVYVKTFDNESFYRGFEQLLTREFVNTLNSRTHLRIAPLGKADTIITGRISDFKQQVLTEDAHDNVRETQITVTVDMTWTDAKTGKAIKTVRGLALSDSIKFEIGQTLDTATPEFFVDMAERLVEELEAPW
jgi:hypothetical protein